MAHRSCFCTGECHDNGGKCPGAPLYPEEKDSLYDLVNHILSENCLWDRFTEEEKKKPMMLSCSCKKCSPASY